MKIEKSKMCLVCLSVRCQAVVVGYFAGWSLHFSNLLKLHFHVSQLDTPTHSLTSNTSASKILQELVYDEVVIFHIMFYANHLLHSSLLLAGIYLWGN